MTQPRQSWRRAVAALVVVFPLIAVGPAHAQTGTAALVGDVMDAQKQVLPGAMVTVTNTGTAASQVTTTDQRGSFRLSNVQPGMYTLKVELAGFKTAIVERVNLQVDSVARESVTLELGGVTETVSVVSETTHLNTTDASVGNVMSREQIRSLPVEAQNVVHLLSLQPGAVFIPTSNPATVDPRYGSVAGARADQQSVTLDGIDVNDPQLATAYTSAIRMTQEALQEFRVSTSNYNAEMGRSSGPQVSLITRSGTNQFDGSGYWTFRRTATSSNEYFLKLSQLAAGGESKAPKLDKDIFGGSLGGPIMRNKLFVFANLESLKEKSEAPVVRNVPSNSMRDGVLLYRCAVAALCPGGTVRGVSNAHTVPEGFYGMTPAEIAAIDPLGIGPSRLALEYFRKYPAPNDPGRDGRNLMDYRFAAPIENDFLNLISRVDYKLATNHNFFARVGKQDDTINTAPQFEEGDPLRRRLFNNWGGAVGYDAVLSRNFTNSFRYGFTKIDENNTGLTQANYVNFRFISPYEGFGSSFTDTRQTPTQNFVNDLSWFKGRHTMKAGTNIRFTRVPKDRFQTSYLSASVNPSWVAGVGRRNMPGSAFCTVAGCNLPAVATNFQGGYADAWLNMLGVLSQATQRANYNKD
ncbi:MAG: carboxypeptidase-like regulatory domain-containing protein, partial [Vicinamibacterales bacterium]